LWSADANLSVSGGRGASANADWSSNKTIALPDFRGRVLAGLDAMGSTAAGRLTTGFVGQPTDTLGYGAGLEGTILTESQIPSHVHNNVIVDAGHQHTYQNASLSVTFAARDAADGNFVTSGSPGLTSLNGTGISINNVAAGGGGAHNNVQPTSGITFYIKL
jgi:microcystin-dependent protein